MTNLLWRPFKIYSGFKYIYPSLRYKQKACAMVRTHIKLIVEEDYSGLVLSFYKEC